MTFKNFIIDNYKNALVNKCKESNCLLRLDGLNNYFILKGEKICSNYRVCDCIIFIIKNNLFIVGLVELKSKTIHADEIREKLINCSKIASDILGKIGYKQFNLKFIHIVLFKGGISKSEYKVLTKNRLKINGIKHNIVLKKCGVKFIDLIKD